MLKNNSFYILYNNNLKNAARYALLFKNLEKQFIPKKMK